MVTRRSGRAETALISRRRATVEQTRCRHPPVKDQGKNKPSTNRTLRHTDSDWPIRRVEIFRFRAGPVNIITKLSACSRHACFKCGLADHPSDKPGRNRRLPKPPRAALQRQASIVASMRHPRISSPNPPPVGSALCLKEGLAGPSVGQTVKESAMAKSPRAALQRQAAITAFARAHQVLVNAPQQAPIIERAPASRVRKLAPPGFGQALQSRQKPQLSEQT